MGMCGRLMILIFGSGLGFASTLVLKNGQGARNPFLLHRKVYSFLTIDFLVPILDCFSESACSSACF